VNVQPNINLKTASLQEIFDYGLAHVRKQRQKCVDKSGHCRMRGIDGTMCVVGSMIDDELAKRADDGNIGSCPDENESLWREVIGDDHAKYVLLHDMQQAHDQADTAYDDPDFMQGFERRMRGIPCKFPAMGLVYTPEAA
jgi:hypothetical protein